MNMPPKHTPITTELYYGTADGQLLGKLGTVTTVELSAETEQYVTDIPTLREMSFGGTFKLETNNERKMRGKPLWRRRVRIQKMLKEASRPPKRRDRNNRGWIE